MGYRKWNSGWQGAKQVSRLLYYKAAPPLLCLCKYIIKNGIAFLFLFVKFAPLAKLNVCCFSFYFLTFISLIINTRMNKWKEKKHFAVMHENNQGNINLTKLIKLRVRKVLLPSAKALGWQGSEYFFNSCPKNIKNTFAKEGYQHFNLPSTDKKKSTQQGGGRAGFLGSTNRRNRKAFVWRILHLH